MTFLRYKRTLWAAVVICVGSAVSNVFGCSLPEAVLLHTIVLGVVLTIFALRRLTTYRPAVPVSYHRVVRSVAWLLPTERAADWAEELQAQLRETSKPRKLAMDIVASTPSLILTTWWTDLLQRRHNRRATATLLLVARLRLLLTPQAPTPSPISSGAFERMQLQRSIGVDRAIGKVPCRSVPALRLARRVLRSRSPGLVEARNTIGELLQVRREAHKVARQLRRDHTAWIRSSVEPYASLRDRENRLRMEAANLALTLRAQLNTFVLERRSLTRRARRRRHRYCSESASRIPGS